jgi:peptidoglycan/LPS O-acetylase OafA/YrhL
VRFDFRLDYGRAVSEWFKAHWQEPITVGFLLKNMALLNLRLNVPTWTLRAEVVCSLALPILFLLSSARWRPLKRVVLAGLILFSFLGHGNLSAWLFMFYLGLLAPTAGKTLMSWLKARMAVFWIPPAAALLLCAGTTLLPSVPRVSNLVEGFAATLFVSALLYGPEFRWFALFDLSVSRFYGRISYSFYLYHMVCLYCVARVTFVFVSPEFLLSWYLPSALLFLLVSTAIATLLAWASHEFVEIPGINFSKSICSRLVKSVTGSSSK